MSEFNTNVGHTITWSARYWLSGQRQLSSFHLDIFKSHGRKSNAVPAYDRMGTVGGECHGVRSCLSWLYSSVDTDTATVRFLFNYWD